MTADRPSKDPGDVTVENAEVPHNLFGDLSTAPVPFDTDYGDLSGTRRLPLILAVIATVLIVAALIAFAFWPPTAPAPEEGPAIGTVLTAREPPPAPVPAAPP